MNMCMCVYEYMMECEYVMGCKCECENVMGCEYVRMCVWRSVDVNGDMIYRGCNQYIC